MRPRRRMTAPPDTQPGVRHPSCSGLRTIMGTVTDEITGWRTSTRSNSGACVEIGQAPAAVGVRDSKDPGSPVLTFRNGAWAAFTASLKAP
jgi:Domain of unknown function (DUF397)